MFKMVKIGIFDASSKFENHELSNKIEKWILNSLGFFIQSTSFVIVYICVLLNKFPSSMFYSIYNVIWQHIKSVYLVYDKSFRQRNSNS